MKMLSLYKVSHLHQSHFCGCCKHCRDRNGVFEVLETIFATLTSILV